MPSVFDVNIFWAIFKDVWEAIKTRSDKQQTNVIAARKQMHSAFIKTYDYLRNRGGAYVPNTELAEGWNDASAAVSVVDKQLGDMLYYKSRFWTDPQLYFNLGKEDEIIELNRIVDEMEHLRIKLG